MLVNLGRFDDAHEFWQMVLDKRIRGLGKTHVLVVRARNMIEGLADAEAQVG
jgi:hypothetical protein